MVDIWNIRNIQGNRGKIASQATPTVVYRTATPSEGKSNLLDSASSSTYDLPWTGTVGTDLASALAAIQGRVADRYKSGAQAGSLSEAALREDEKRMQLVQALQSLSTDPTRANSIQAGVDAQMAAARQNAADQAGSANGGLLMTAASKGMLGSGNVGRGKEQIVQAKNAAVNQAATSATDWKQSINDSDNAYIYQQLQSILAPSSESQAAQQAASAGYQTGLGLTQQLADARSQQNQILANSIGGFMQNTLAPGISAAFSTARARNAAGSDYRSPASYIFGGG